MVLGRAAVVRTLWISSGVVVPMLLGLLGGPLPASLLTAVIALVVVGQVAVEARLEGRAGDPSVDEPGPGPASPAAG